MANVMGAFFEPSRHEQHGLGTQQQVPVRLLWGRTSIKPRSLPWNSSCIWWPATGAGECRNYLSHSQTMVTCKTLVSLHPRLLAAESTSWIAQRE